MAFPEDLLDIFVDLDLDGDGVFEEDITDDVMVRDSQGRIDIVRGRSRESQDVEPGRCSFQLNNREGKYSPRNPLGPYYGQLRRNTKVRVSVDHGESYIDNPGGASDGASTPDHASLDITGDIDIRVDQTMNSTALGGLAGKYETTGEQRSWAFWFESSLSLFFRWSPDGTLTNAITVSSSQVPLYQSLRTAFRVTLDVDNGSGGYTVRFYTAPSIDGEWTMFDEEVTTSGTTSIFSSTTEVTVGRTNDLSAGGWDGKIHAAEIRNGIDGTVVANPDFRAEPPGTTSFADSSGRTWTLTGSAALSNKKVRFVGEVAEWPVEWDTSGNDVWVDVEAAGITRRLDARPTPVASAMRTRIPSFSPLQYWPMEDGESSTEAASALDGGSPLRVGDLDFASAPGPDGSDSLPVVRTGTTLLGTVPASSATEWHFEFVYRLDTAPSAKTTIIAFGIGGGNVGTWRLSLQSGTATIEAFHAETGGLVVNQAIDISGNPEIFGDWVRWQLFAEQSGGNILWTTRWIFIGETSVQFNSNFAGSVGYIRTVAGPGAGYTSEADGLGLGHIAVFDQADTAAFNTADTGFAGESAVNRIVRLGDQEGVPYQAVLSALTATTVTSSSELMGAQRVKRLMELFRECQDADHGVLGEVRDLPRILYRHRASIENQPVWASFDYETQLMPGILPTDDDKNLLNRAQVNRDRGSFGVAEVTEGPLSSQEPPNGAGLYSGEFDLNLYTDDRPQHHAGWLVQHGTVDEARFPRMYFNLARNPEIADDLMRLDIGDRYQITDVPAKLMYNDLDLIMIGYTETLHQRVWEFEVNAEPASPWNVAVLEGETSVTEELGRADTDGSELLTSITSTATSMDVYAHTGETWTTDSAEYPFDVDMGGERITATDATGVAEDDFSTNVTDGWGTADVGGAWSTAGGTAPGDFDVVSGRGTHTLTTVNVSRRSFLTTSTAVDIDVQADIQTSALATGAALNGGLTARHTSGDDLYQALVSFNTTQTVTLTILKRTGGVQTTLVSAVVAGLTHAANTDVRLRFKVDGSTLMAKVWNPSLPEPAGWRLITTDTDHTTTSFIGCRSIATTGNTNVNPIVRYDNYVVLNPTRWAVTRSVNGVVKAQTAGTDVRLWTPSIAAL